jgi:glycine oxidase
MQKFFTVIIGGGIIGKTISFELTRRNIENVIIDDQTFKKTTYVAAGMIAPISEAVFNEESLIEPNLHSHSKWLDLAKDLTEITGNPSSLSQIPALLVAKTSDDRAILDNLLGFYDRCHLQTTRLSVAESQQLVEGLTPNLNSGALLNSDYFLEPKLEMQLLDQALNKLKVKTIFERATDINADHPGQIKITLSDSNQIVAENVVFATGLGGMDLLGEPFKSDLGIIKVKGQIITLKQSFSTKKLERVIRGTVNRTPIYLVPRSNNMIAVGATQETTGFDTGNTVEGLYNLLQPAIELYPSLREAEIIAIDYGFRPGTKDNIAYIGRIANSSILCAIGHFRHGILQAPLTAEIIADEIEQVPNCFANVFSPNRAIGKINIQ